MKHVIFFFLLMASASAQIPELPNNIVANRTSKPITRFEFWIDANLQRFYNNTIDSKGRIIQEIITETEEAMPGIIKNKSRISTSYDDNGRDTSEIREAFDVTKKDWVYTYKVTNEWSDNGNLLKNASYFYNVENDKWYPNYAIENKYDKFNNNVYYLVYKHIGNGVLAPSDLRTWDYNDSNQLTRSTIGGFNPDYIINEISYYFYDLQGKQTQIKSFWDTTKAPVRMTDFNYNSDGRLIEKNYTSIDSDTNNVSMKEYFDWDSAGNQILYTTIDTYNGELSNKSETRWTYDSRHNITSESIEYSNTDLQKLDKYLRTTLTYNENNNYLTKTMEGDSSGNWQLKDRLILSYNELGQEISGIYQVFTQGQWVNYNRTIREFDKDGDLISSNPQTWYDDWYDQSGNLDFRTPGTKYYLDGMKLKVFYGQTEIIEELAAEGVITITPNPANDYIEISVGAQRAMTDDISIFDILGVEVLNNSQFSIFNSQLRIDVSVLPPGIYFVRVGDVVQKFIKL